MKKIKQNDVLVGGWMAGWVDVQIGRLDGQTGRLDIERMDRPDGQADRQNGWTDRLAGQTEDETDRWQIEPYSQRNADVMVQ